MSLADLTPVSLETSQDPEEHSGEESMPAPKSKATEKKAGRRKINIEFIEDKNRRHITFSKRKAGIMKKAYELSTLTGTQVLLLVASETGHVYTFATTKLQPLITKPEGKNLIQACLNAPDVPQQPAPQIPRVHQSYGESPLLYQAPPQDQISADVYGEKEKGGRQEQQNRAFNTPIDMQVNFPNNYNPPTNLMTPGVRLGYPMPSSMGSMPRYSNVMNTQAPSYHYGGQPQFSAANAVAATQQSQYSTSASASPYNLGWSGKQQFQGIPMQHQMHGQDQQKKD